MKKALYIFALLTIVFSSCQDVITLDISSKDSKLAVDGWIDSDSFPKIFLYQSLPYFDNNPYPAATGATVTLNNGTKTVTLAESAAGSGFYTTKDMVGEVGKKYTLSITYNGKVYTAIDEMAKTIPMFDSIYFRPFPFSQPGQAPPIITAFAYQEWPEVGNCYMARFSKNDTMDLKNLSYTNDQFVNGTHLADVYVGEPVKPGDRIRLEAYGISPKYYNYLNQIINNVYRQQGLFSPPLAPYTGNVSNEGLGFFRASQMIAKDTIVP